MRLEEAKQILKKNGYLLEDKYMDDLDAELDEITKPITVDEINPDNYEDYIGKFVNVTGNVYLSSLGLPELPIKFGKVGGHFVCSYNELTSLEGSPREVGGLFYCYGNELTTLEGAPKIVGKNFDCNRNKLTTLKGGPEEVWRWFLLL